jgi:probable HAF family extracellular repeat protein
VTQLDYPYDCSIGAVITYGNGLNNNGAVVGSWQCSTWKHTEAFLWTPEGGFVTLPRPPGVYSSSAADINDAGVIVGTYSTAASMAIGFIYQDGTYTEIPPQPGGLWSWCRAINNEGTVVGGRSIGPGITPYNAYVFSPEEGITDLGVMNGPYSSAVDVGPEGLVVGSTGNSGSISAGFLWEAGRLALIAPIPGGVTSGLGGVGSNGIVVGGGEMQYLPGGAMYGFLWRNGEFTIVEPLAGYDTSGANDINSASQVTGLSVRWDDVDNPHATLWQHGVTHDLNQLVAAGTPILERARAINELGQILVDGGIRSFLLTPVGRPPGDLDIDCRVQITDFLRLLEEWGEQNSSADLNSDGTVDQTDFAILLKNWSGG